MIRAYLGLFMVVLAMSLTDQSPLGLVVFTGIGSTGALLIWSAYKDGKIV